MSKGRSPKCPAINLETAIGCVRVIHEKEDTNKGSKEVLARDLGHTGTNNGSFLRKFAALSGYGLVEEDRSTKKFGVSPVAVDILTLHEGNPKRTEAIEMAAFTPPLFATLHAEYSQKKLPSDGLLQDELVEKGFLQKTAKEAVQIYRDNLTLVEKERSAAAEPEPVPIESAPAPMPSPSDQPIDADYEPVPVQPPSSATRESQPDDMLVLRIAKNCRVQLAFSGPVTQDAIESLRKQLDAMKDNYPGNGGPSTPTPIALEDGTGE